MNEEYNKQCDAAHNQSPHRVCVMSVPYFQQITGHKPYAWHERFFQALMRGEIPHEITRPTGTGKTMVILLYMIALARGAPIPRRIAYVVDRRSIVDQTHAHITHWLDHIKGIPDFKAALDALAAFPNNDSPVLTATLRGGLVDGGEWRLDPACPAIVIGTVDMIGSRLLFKGYGDGRNRRSLHAGLLGVGTCLMLDESHLSPAGHDCFQQIEALNGGCFGHNFKTMAVSATTASSEVDRLTEDDFNDPALAPRLNAHKKLGLHEVDSGVVPRRNKILDLLLGYEEGAIIAFLASAQEAKQLYTDLCKEIDDPNGERVALYMGPLRGHERGQATQTAVWKRLTQPNAHADTGPPVFLIATAAAEVGVDLDSCHAVMDLAPCDSLIQRLGRVNRTGRRQQSHVHVVYSEQDLKHDPKKNDWKNRVAQAKANTLKLLNNGSDASPAAIRHWPQDLVHEARTPQPRLVPLTANRTSLYAATSIRVDLPPVAYHLRGDDDEPDPGETQIYWRWDVAPLIAAGEKACQDAIAMMPPQPRELLRAPSGVVEKTLAEIAGRTGPFECIIIQADGALLVVRVTDNSRDPLGSDLRYATVILPTEVGGLGTAGQLDAKARAPVSDLADDPESAVRFKLPDAGSQTLPEWVEQATQWRFPLSHDLDDDNANTHWLIYARRRLDSLSLDAEGDLSRLARSQQDLADHNEHVGRAAYQIGCALGLREWVCGALKHSGCFHDSGKDRPIWQGAAGNTASSPIAKAKSGAFQPSLLGGYRHEFGSLAEVDRRLDSEHASHDLERDLILHLIAAHHGHARPGFQTHQQFDPALPAGAAPHLAKQVEKRFERLQRAFGPWGLAWLEALLKCADARVSSGLPIGDQS